MVIEIDNDNKLAYIWLSNSEQNNHQTTYKVSTLTKEFSNKKYKTVIFKSGREDLLSLTEKLLKLNRNIIL